MSRRLPVRRLAAAAVLPLALATLSACGEDEAAPTKAADESSESAAPADDSDAAPDVSPGDSVEKADFMELYRSSIEDFTTADVAMDVKSSGTAMKAEGAVDYSSEPASMELAYDMAGQKMEMLMVDNVMYMKSPDMGEKWVTFDMSEAAEGMGVDLGAQMDMRAMMETFESGITEVTYVGEADVSGDETDQYRLTVDTKTMTGDLDLGELGAEAQSQMPKTITFDVFFNDDEQFRRLSMDMGKDMSMTMDYDNWGTDVDIEAPPADETTSMEELMGSISGGAGAGGGRS